MSEPIRLHQSGVSVWERWESWYTGEPTHLALPADEMRALLALRDAQARPAPDPTTQDLVNAWVIARARWGESGVLSDVDACRAADRALVRHLDAPQAPRGEE